jgi:hypothetical protein
MSNPSVSSSSLHSVERSAASIVRIPSRILIALSVLLMALPMAWSQAAPSFAISGGNQLSGTLDTLTAPAVTVFNNQILTVWCGPVNQYNGAPLESSLQGSVTATPTIYSNNDFCEGSTAGRLSVAVFNGKIYVTGPPVNSMLPQPYYPTIYTSVDGINWQSSYANLQYNGSVDGSSQGLGLAVFNGQLYLAYLSSSTATVSVASSTDGQNFNWVSTASTYALNPSPNPSNWIQSPALYYWVNEYGQGDLYLSYLTTGGQIVMSYTHDGQNWSTQVAPGTILKGDVMLVSHNSALYYGGQSYYSSNNLWMAGSYDGYTWPAGINYGGIMRTSPSAVDFGGTFYTVWAGCCNANLWRYWAY